MWLSALRLAHEIWAGLCLGFSGTLLLSLLVLWRRRAAIPPPPVRWPSLVLLRPCEGPEPDLLATLAATLAALRQYPGDARLIVLVPSPDDPCHAQATRALQALSPVERSRVDLHCTHPPALCNRKVFQLQAGVSATASDLLVWADSDVLFDYDDLLALLLPFLSPVPAASPVGACFAAPIEDRPQTPADFASAALVGASPQSFLALYALHALHPALSAPNMAGALCALSRQALLAIGGLAPFVDCLGEDNAIARALVVHRYTVALSARPAQCLDQGRSASAALLRVSRWLTVVRAQHPWLLPAYPVLFFSTPLLLTSLACWQSPRLLAFVGAGVLLRVALAAVLRRMQHRATSPFRALGEVFSAEILLALGFFHGLFVRTVVWRGHRFRILSGGRFHRTT